jgi:predicted phosphodiesterase
LKAHQGQQVKFVFFHRPSWLMQVLLRNEQFPVHQLLKRYGVHYVICGHIHQMLWFELDGINYICIGSSGGHLRQQNAYDKGWFFQHTLATVRGTNVEMRIEELGPPFGKGRVTALQDWSGFRLAEKRF